MSIYTKFQEEEKGESIRYPVSEIVKDNYDGVRKKSSYSDTN